MDRKEFLSLLGAGAAAVVASGLLNACNNANNNITNPITADFTLNLTDGAYSALQSNGGFVYSNDVIVARTMTGTFIAVSAICTHAGGVVSYVPNTNIFRCPLHGSNFTSTGAVANGPASTPLQQFKTALNGSILRVYS
jgi:cytochrome b6-f complex iron-sulfur subunit